MAEGEMISSDMPGTEEFAGQTMEELGAALPIQGEASKAPKLAGGSDEGGQRQERGQGAGASQEAKVEQAAAAGQLDPKPGDDIATLNAKLDVLEQTIKNMGRENGAARALQAKVAKLEAQLAQRGQNPTLSPEQQAQEAERAKAEEFLNSWLDKQMGEKYGHLIQPLQRQAFIGGVQQRCQELGFKFDELNPVFGKIINDDIALAQSGDEAAGARLDRIMKQGDSTELMLRAISEQARVVQTRGAQVQQANAKAAEKGGRALKASGAQPTKASGPNLDDVENMSEEERDKLSLEELEKLVPKQRRR